MTKRLFDLLVSLGMLVLLLPLFALVAVLIKLDSKGPVFFRQKRVGRFGEPFWIFKFRSMVTNAAAVGPYYTSTNDPRITRVGRWLRKTSLDELPQLLNVVRGEMSLVGPRPNVYDQRAEYTPEEWEVRNQVCPGITGLAQATRRSAATVNERNNLDLEYIRKQSLLCDLKIILLTMRQVLTTGGN
jgi:lipopolysaccharide/colanic/teichoic acid biosynthesis glycosyltransferase